jgi:Predicted integral membrane protein (DUF2269)
MNLFPWLLFAHVLGAIIAFGPTFSFPIIGRLGAQERIHGNFATRLSYALSHVQVVPFAVLQGITGVGLILTANIDVMSTPWLLVAIVLYLIALGFALFVQTPTVKQIIKLTSGSPPAAGVPAGSEGPPAGEPGPGAGGPPPGLMRLVRRVQLGGLFLMALVVSIVFLMVVKPF